MKRHKTAKGEKGWEEKRKQVRNRLNLDDDAIEGIRKEVIRGKAEGKRLKSLGITRCTKT